MNARRRAAPLCVALVLASTAGCTGVTGAGPTAQSVGAIQGGTDDSTHTAVVSIVLQVSGGIALCSGSLIAPNLVLTARHCVSALSSTREFNCQDYTDSTGSHAATTARAPYSADSFGVTTDEFVGRGSNFVAVAEVLVPPGSTGVPLCGKDIAMLRLASPITDAGLIVPRLDLEAQVNDTFTAVGYGGTDSMGDGSGQRRQRSGLTVQYVGQAYARDGSMNVMVTAMEELIANTGTCEGDSGGPALDVLGQTFGVLSRGDATSCDGPIYTRVDAYASWIRSGAQAAAAALGQPAQPWVTPPASGSANQGDDCVSDDQCVVPLNCLVIGSRRRCTTTDCSSCPTGWVCGTASGMNACVPDPNAPQPTGDDAGTGPSTTGGDDAGTGPTMTGDDDAGSGSTGGSMGGGCSVRRGREETGAHGAAFAAGVALAMAAGVRRRRARRARP